MQSIVDVFAYQTVMLALLFQFIWLVLARRGRDKYIDDLTHFRRPSGALARYYEWRIARLKHVTAEVVLFHSILIASILVMAYMMHLGEDIIPGIPIILFVIGLSVLSGLQSIWRIRKVLERENALYWKLEKSEDKIMTAQEIVRRLYLAGEAADGHDWFALFRLAQKANPVGYSVREVLLEKGREILMERERAARASSAGGGGGEMGPDIA